MSAERVQDVRAGPSGDQTVEDVPAVETEDIAEHAPDADAAAVEDLLHAVARLAALPDQRAPMADQIPQVAKTPRRARNSAGRARTDTPAPISGLRCRSCGRAVAAHAARAAIAPRCRQRPRWMGQIRPVCPAGHTGRIWVPTEGRVGSLTGGAIHQRLAGRGSAGETRSIEVRYAKSRLACSARSDACPDRLHGRPCALHRIVPRETPEPW